MKMKPLLFMAALALVLAALPPAGYDRVKVYVGHGAAFRHAACQLGVLELSQVRQLSMHHCLPLLLEHLPDGNWLHIGGEWKVRPEHSSFTD